MYVLSTSELNYESVVHCLPLSNYRSWKYVMSIISPETLFAYSHHFFSVFTINVLKLILLRKTILCFISITSN